LRVSAVSAPGPRDKLSPELLTASGLSCVRCSERFATESSTRGNPSTAEPWHSPPHPKARCQGFLPSEIYGQSGWVPAIHTSRWRVQRIPADGREVPSPQTRKVIEASPLDPATNLAGALRAPPDRRSLCVVPWPEISKQFQKFALILRRTFPRLVPRRVSDHPPTPRSPSAEDHSKSSRNKARVDTSKNAGGSGVVPGISNSSSL
jgi:hypothetical protein